MSLSVENTGGIRFFPKYKFLECCLHQTKYVKGKNSLPRLAALAQGLIFTYQRGWGCKIYPYINMKLPYRHQRKITRKKKLLKGQAAYCLNMLGSTRTTYGANSALLRSEVLVVDRYCSTPTFPFRSDVQPTSFTHKINNQHTKCALKFSFIAHKCSDPDNLNVIFLNVCFQ